MHYTEPKIIRTGDAILAIQSVNQTDDSLKPPSTILDSNHTVKTTVGAYEADE